MTKKVYVVIEDFGEDGISVIRVYADKPPAEAEATVSPCCYWVEAEFVDGNVTSSPADNRVDESITGYPKVQFLPEDSHDFGVVSGSDCHETTSSPADNSASPVPPVDPAASTAR